MKKLVLMLGVLLIAGSGVAYAAGCCGGNGPQSGYSGVGLGVPQGGYGNASCCSLIPQRLLSMPQAVAPLEAPIFLKGKPVSSR